ncbi:MAG: hypothetical protein K0R63_781 [Rickettsiales bacterium]|jgi:Ca2+-binding RTX toxin-like protein|nr:hypothetical protein [Rickettsiales bacterium]
MLATKDAASIISGHTFTGTVEKPTTVGYSFENRFYGGMEMNNEQRAAVRDTLQHFSNVADIEFKEIPPLPGFRPAPTQEGFELAFAHSVYQNGQGGAGRYVVESQTKITNAQVNIDTFTKDFQEGGEGHTTLLYHIGSVIGLKDPDPKKSPIYTASEDNKEGGVVVKSPSSQPTTTPTPTKLPSTPEPTPAPKTEEKTEDKSEESFLSDLGSKIGSTVGQFLDHFPGTKGYGEMLHNAGQAVGLIDKSTTNTGSKTSDTHAITSETTHKAALNEKPAVLPEALDKPEFTIMSTKEGNYKDLNPSGPMILDIAALQHLYGVNYEYHAGDDVYKYDGGKLLTTIWDGGGHDTIDTTPYKGNVILDLRESTDYATHLGDSHIWNAFGANIENGVTGNGDDVLNGNELGNRLVGNGGNDTIHGNGGDDVILGGSGNDVLEGGEGNDTIFGGSENDVIKGDAGNDFLYGEEGNDTINGGDGSDFINGNQGNDLLYGDAGNDTIHGGQGADKIYGGNGDDQLFGDKGNDLIYGDAGNDTIHGGQGDDIIYGGEGNDLIYGDRGNDRMEGGAGNDVFVFGPDSGVDIITDFSGAGKDVGDVLRISREIYNTPQAALSHVNYHDGNATVDLGHGNSVTLLGVGSGLAVDDFQVF